MRTQRSRPCLHMATLAQQPGGMRKMRRSHSAGRRRPCPGRWKDSVAVHECGFCLAAGWDTDPAKQPRVRTEAVSRQPGDRMSPILPLVPACLPARRAENGRGGCSGHGPMHEFLILFTCIGALISCTHLPTHSLAHLFTGTQSPSFTGHCLWGPTRWDGQAPDR